MSTIHIPTSFNISITFPAASFHRRLGAWCLDLIILITYIWLVSKIFSAFLDGSPFEQTGERQVLRGLWMFLLVVPTFTYHPVCELLLNGQSIGKMVAGLRVINDKGGRPSISQVLIRWLIRTSDVMVLVLMVYGALASVYPQVLKEVAIAFGLLVLDIVLVNVNRRHQRLGDILAHTILIRTTQRTGIEETIFQDVVDTYTPQFPQVLQLSDRDINAIKSILDSAKKHEDYALAERAANKIRNHLRLENSMSPYDFLEILLKDYNYLTTH